MYLRFNKDREDVQGSKVHRKSMYRPHDLIKAEVHGKLHEAERDNTGVEAAHKTELAAESAGTVIHRKIKAGAYAKANKKKEPIANAKSKPKPQEKTSTVRAKHKADPATSSKTAKEKSSASKAIQKRQIKKQYAKAVRAGKVSGTKTAAVSQTGIRNKAAAAVKRLAAFIARHGKVLAVVLVIILILCLLFSAITSCSAMMQSGLTSIIASTYTSEDADILEVDAYYSSLEESVRTSVSSVESSNSGYDEYRYSVDEVGHNPFQLASYLHAKFGSYTLSMVKDELDTLITQQYSITTSETVEDEKRILTITLRNYGLAGVLHNLTEDQKGLYEILQDTHGNKSYLFEESGHIGGGGAYTDYDIPSEALTDAKFAAMIREAEKYLGYPYVWGGSSPSTSFDCSGFVCWVINQSGVGSVGRTHAGGLFDICAKIPPADAKPGDLIFFHSTYPTSGVSHVGIYVGGGMMIHCGDPISYASVNSSYWQQHFLAYGRLP